ncbi:toxin-antitoxin system YwqK family antitoxin [Hyphomonas oceanitis]|uniref:toxin-antitoxin system YwqK family antitoxin n=1 Tax=Hyphomonas oceanitis TaxID=81033 RepID=UPI003002C249
MRFALAALAATILLLSACTKEVDTSELVVRNGIAFEINSQTPFTGNAKTFYANGQLAIQSSYVEGVASGRFEHWYDNGTLSIKCVNKSGALEGLCTTWHENGQLRDEVNYIEGEKNGLSKTWFENGQLEEEVNYIAGEKSGLSKTWFENGQLEEEVNYIAGEKSGLSKTWFENGQLAEQANFLNDQKDGPLRKWTEDGVLFLEVDYKSGALQVAKLVELDGLYYEAGSDTPFSGRITYERKTGTRWFVEELQDGRVSGYRRSWSEDGQLRAEYLMKNGNLLHTREWHDNGQLKLEVFTYDDPKEFFRPKSVRRWNEAGDLMLEESKDWDEIGNLLPGR